MFNSSLPINLFKGAYLGTVVGILTSTAEKNGNMIQGAKWGVVSGLGLAAIGQFVAALARSLGLGKVSGSLIGNRKIKINTDKIIKDVIEQLQYLCLYRIFAAAWPMQGVRYIDGEAIMCLCTAFTINKLGDLLVSKFPKISQKNNVEQMEFSIEHLKNFGLRGMDKHLKELQRLLYSRMSAHREEAINRGLKPIKGLLLYGPPGTGKTTLAKHLGKMLGCSEDRIIFKAAPELLNMFLGESENNVRALFEPAEKEQKKYGKESLLHVVVIDEIDALIGNRDNRHFQNPVYMCEQFLTCMDGLNPIENLVVIGITNRYNELDKAAIRPGRFDIQLEIGLPDAAGRKDIFQYYLGKIAAYLDESVNIEELVNMVGDFSGADIESLVNTANGAAFVRGKNAKNKDNPSAGKIKMADFKKALQSFKERGSHGKLPEGMYV